jgi:hypothetical protein
MLLAARMVDMAMNFYLKSNGIQAEIHIRHNDNESNMHKRKSFLTREFQPTIADDTEFKITSNYILYYLN